ncbi:hypothetical protein PFICI_12773 [Pestalotiopsis fici W106-1]|uniref:DNA mismatch repair protein HSM3 N-terminal domain-containing protein n=1 Tax=Pestalotiopsis fici (strain W106-1 / CGMCC3.15140) TaxID=1229662 RepID=W3WPW3_PESFW|nr:uncharacterized protein PFICI_12773 [Pestalotiopsis fici W106-1]ETS75829.1 hypothetical protein PFICI_12773 [Pestalotiopsis fici W106-1]
MDDTVVPLTGVDELDKHLDQLIADPTLASNIKLFDNVTLQLTEVNIPPLIPRLLPKITEILKQYQQDPAILCELAIKLLGPLTFTQVMALASEDAIIQAMRSPAPSANLLAMAVLEKAAQSPGEAAILATLKNIVANFVVQWLSAPQVEVGEKGSKVLGDLLDVDCAVRPAQGVSLNGQEIVLRRPPGQGLVWRRIFHDRDIYGSILSLSSFGGHHHDAEGGLSDHQITLAQGRLLRLLPRLAALDLAAITKTEFPDLHERFTGEVEKNSNDEGLLQFAGLRMINNEDLLMHLSLIDFFETLVSIQRITPFSTYKTETLGVLLRQAVSRDPELKSAIISLPERTVPEEANDLRTFIGTLIRG